jgi:galactoside O-acetyltransferase
MNVMKNIFFDINDLGYVGTNVIIGKTVRIRNPEHVYIGNNCIIDDFTYISSYLHLGDYSHIASHVNISGSTGKLSTGQFCGIGAFNSIHCATSDFLKASLDMPSVPSDMRFGGFQEEIIFKDYIQLGSHTTILPGVKLPEGVATASQTILRKKLYEEWTLYSGNNGKKIIKRDNSEIKKIILKLK